jgi:hypothetical protein
MARPSLFIARGFIFKPNFSQVRSKIVLQLVSGSKALAEQQVCITCAAYRASFLLSLTYRNVKNMIKCSFARTVSMYTQPALSIKRNRTRQTALGWGDRVASKNDRGVLSFVTAERLV